MSAGLGVDVALAGSTGLALVLVASEPLLDAENGRAVDLRRLGERGNSGHLRDKLVMVEWKCCVTYVGAESDLVEIERVRRRASTADGGPGLVLDDLDIVVAAEGVADLVRRELVVVQAELDSNILLQGEQLLEDCTELVVVVDRDGAATERL
jgi:hypothetical protein